jgi:hypothetical protein
MKNERVLLAEWLGDTTDGYIDIPWPLVHSLADPECIKWINQHSVDQVQMILDRAQGRDSGLQRLYAEFYRPGLRSEFALRFAK